MTYQHMHTDPADDFPEMCAIPGIQDDYASYMQCLIQITQVVTNAHDLLYPSKSRSAAMAKAEHYYKHIDDFGESTTAVAVGKHVTDVPSLVRISSSMAEEAMADISYQ